MSEPRTSNEMKVFAKRLREHFSEKGINLSHSEALEATAAAHGYHDWNTASAASQDATKIFVINCYCDADQEDPDLSATFQYVVRATSRNEAVEILDEHITELVRPKVTDFFPLSYYVEDIFEIDPSNRDGAPINMSIDYGQSEWPMPYGAMKGVTCWRGDQPINLNDQAFRGPQREQIIYLEEYEEREDSLEENGDAGKDNDD